MDFEAKARSITKIEPKSIDFNKRVVCKLPNLQELTYELKPEYKNNQLIAEGPAKQDFGEAKLSFEFHQDGQVLIWMDFNGEKNKSGENSLPSRGMIIANDNVKLVVLEVEEDLVDSFFYQPVFMHTFYKDTGAYVYHKVNSLMGSIPRATTSMGYCS